MIKQLIFYCLLGLPVVLCIAADVIVLLMRLNRFHTFKSENARHAFLAMTIGCMVGPVPYILMLFGAMGDNVGANAAAFMFFMYLAGLFIFPLITVIVAGLCSLLLRIRAAEAILLNLCAVVALVSLVLFVRGVYGLRPAIVHSVAESMRERALASGDPSICNRIPQMDNSGMLDERDLCRVMVALDKQDIRICDTLSDNPKYNCYKLIASDTRNTGLCENLPVPTQKVSCYERIAIVSNDSDICRKASEVTVEEGCYADLADDLHNPILCGNISDQNRSEDCYGHLVWYIRDPPLCELVPDSSRYDCYLNVFRQLGKNDVGRCSEVVDLQYQDICYSIIAKDVKDPTICDAISDTWPENIWWSREVCRKESAPTG